ncbi:MAG: ABC transporter ATP-binding protein, partial [Eubacteriales bacterium]|nr:ABC transporter ATP-binding protein [Eubacteriales bacterium]
MAILEMKDICKAFSGVYANENICLTVEKGSIHALLGENGAGKTTLVNILYGIYSADSGEIRWKGDSVRFDSPREAIQSGIGMVQQHFSLVRRMTVLDNIILSLKGNGFVLDRKAAAKRVSDLAQKYGLTVNPSARISDLSVGERQRVEILKALYRDVELLILDEPTGVLTPQETAQFFDVLRTLKSEGYAIIIITHRMSEIMAVSDRVTILRDGRNVADLTTAQTHPAELSRYMIGRELHEAAAPGQPAQNGDRLVMEGVRLAARHRQHALHGISLRVRRGEILGIAGVEGNGQKELAEVITGLRRLNEGSIALDGRDIGRLSVKKRYEAGIAYISDDRQNDGLLMGMSVSENLMLREFDRPPFSRHGVIDRRAAARNAETKMKTYQIRASGKTGAQTPAGLLSGGNQQKLVIARELSENATLIVASQPTRGLDIGATEFVRSLLVRERNAGKSVVLISADLEEIMA